MPEKEKQLTKTAQKKLEIKKRQAFTRQVFDLVLKMLSSTTQKTRKTFNIKITLQNSNRYFHFPAYGRSIKILIYKDGNIVLELKEICHDDFRVPLFIFAPDESAQADFLEHFKKILSWLFPLIIDEGPGGLDFHSYMDYVSMGDIEKAYEAAVRDFTHPGIKEAEHHVD